MDKDVFKISVNLKDRPATRRGMLSTITGIYDPLGFACSPALLPGKIILQELCKMGCGWDDKLPHEVTPLKAVSIPRLELATATLAVKNDQTLRNEFEFEIHDSQFWSDSTTVIKYVNNADKRFKTYVANRLAMIHAGSNPDQWHYIRSKMNPADAVSQGVSAQEFLQADWVSGPSLLRLPECDWPKGLDNLEIHEDPEVKEVSSFQTSVKQVDSESKSENNVIADDTGYMLLNMANKFSSWYKLKAVTAWVLRFLRNLKAAVTAKHDKGVQRYTGFMTVPEIRHAEKVLLQAVQSKYYSYEMRILSGACRRKTLKQTSPIKRLDPVLLRVKGRLANSNLPYSSKHPIILPKGSYVTRLIVTYYHSCVDCIKRQGAVHGQKMANLPADRVTPDKPPFT
ncbi:uncharacterized protein LOC141904296 [Tubulanus polymorphus]|uniref:uncharacterized protein LOC141904296 n=1 Tax=Tubulanus polymorphus TaxID=672921 RepID=UPI003DA2B144